MKEIESILEPIAGYLSSITRNTVAGWYELTIGIHKNWVFNDNNEIGIEVLSEMETGKLLKIFPKNTDVVIDDLVLFVNVIIDTNQKIAEKEKEFADKMEEMKKSLEKQASEFYKELDELKDNSFKKLNDKFVAGLNGEKKTIRHRRTKAQMLSGSTRTDTEGEFTPAPDNIKTS